MYAIARNYRRAASLLAALAAAAVAVSPANLLAACVCRADCCQDNGPSAVQSKSCCDAAVQTCCPSCGEQDTRCGVANYAGGCCCELGQPTQPLEPRDARTPRTGDHHWDGAAAGYVPPFIHGQSAVSLPETLSPLPPGPPVRVLYCVWRN